MAYKDSFYSTGHSTLPIPTYFVFARSQSQIRARPPSSLFSFVSAITLWWIYNPSESWPKKYHHDRATRAKGNSKGSQWMGYPNCYKSFGSRYHFIKFSWYVIIVFFAFVSLNQHTINFHISLTAYLQWIIWCALIIFMTCNDIILCEKYSEALW